VGPTSLQQVAGDMTTAERRSDIYDSVALTDQRVPDVGYMPTRSTVGDLVGAFDQRRSKRHRVARLDERPGAGVGRQAGPLWRPPCSNNRRGVRKKRVAADRFQPKETKSSPAGVLP